MSENLKKDELVCGNTQNFQFSSKHLHPPKALCKAEPNGVHLTVFPFYCVRKGWLDLSFHERYRLFEILKMFYPPKRLCENRTQGGLFDFFSFSCVLETVLTLSKSQSSIGLFETKTCFILIRYSLKQNPMGSI